MRSSLRHDDPSQQGTAPSARLAVLAVNQVTQLESASCSLRVDVVRNRGPAMLDGLLQQSNDHRVKLRSTRPSEPPGPRPRVDAGSKQCFVGINITDSANKALVQQQRLDFGVALCDLL